MLIRDFLFVYSVWLAICPVDIREEEKVFSKFFGQTNIREFLIINDRENVVQTPSSIDREKGTKNFAYISMGEKKPCIFLFTLK